MLKFVQLFVDNYCVICDTIISNKQYTSPSKVRFTEHRCAINKAFKAARNGVAVSA